LQGELEDERGTCEQLRSENEQLRSEAQNLRDCLDQTGNNTANASREEDAGGDDAKEAMMEEVVRLQNENQGLADTVRIKDKIIADGK
jgi:regulator of replication initiation timing